MRYFVAAVLGLVLAPVLLYALGWATAAAAASWSDGPGPATSAGMAATGVLVIVGVGIAVLIRGLSPLTALIVGLGFLALNVMHLVAVPASAVLPSSAGGIEIEWVGTAALLQQSVVAMLGVALVVSALSPARWRTGPAAAEPDPDYLQPPPMPQVGSQSWTYDPTPPGGFPGPSGPATSRGDYPTTR